LLSNLKQVSIKDNIPIVRDKTIDYISKYIDNHSYQSVLEIGSAYGYSALYTALHTNATSIISVEKNESNYQKCLEYARNEKIRFINDDAFTFEINQKFDVIFIDGPKSNQDKLVTKYLALLNKDGTIFIDNIYLNKFKHRDVLTKNQKKLLEKVEAFKK
jgi:predicted O-methyltransferase YrrM